MAKVLGPTEVQVDDLRLIAFFDSETVRRLNAEFGGLRVRHFCIYVEMPEKKLEAITISHESPKDETAGIATLSADNPLVLERLMKALGIDSK